MVTITRKVRGLEDTGSAPFPGTSIVGQNHNHLHEMRWCVRGKDLQINGIMMDPYGPFPVNGHKLPGGTAWDGIV